MTTELDHAYFAGFFDGEGSIDIRYCKTHGGRYERFYLRCAAVQLRREVLDRMQTVYGGSISERHGGGTHIWVTTTRAAEAFLRSVRPHLIVKSDEADIALRFQETFQQRAQWKGIGNGKGYALLPETTRDQRYQLMHELRQWRQDRGLYARNRASVPAKRGLQTLPSAA